MFAECIHSFADTTNQIILAYGIHKSTQVREIATNPNKICFVNFILN